MRRLFTFYALHPASHSTQHNMLQHICPTQRATSRPNATRRHYKYTLYPRTLHATSQEATLQESFYVVLPHNKPYTIHHEPQTQTSLHNIKHFLMLPTICLYFHSCIAALPRTLHFTLHHIMVYTASHCPMICLSQNTK